MSDSAPPNPWRNTSGLFGALTGLLFLAVVQHRYLLIPFRPERRCGKRRIGWIRNCGALTLWLAGIGLVALDLASFAVSSAHAQMSVFEGERLKIDLGVDASTVFFAQDNPWFGEPVANIGADTDSWLEVGAEPAVYLSYDQIFGGELFGGVSVVGTKTFGESADGLGVGFNDPGEVTLELAFGGWRRAFGNGISVELQGGNFDYQIGTGFLIKDGGGDGGNRGGFYLGARSAFRESGLVRLEIGDARVEFFHLGNNPRRGGIKGELVGGNLEYDIEGLATVGVTYLDIVDVDDADIGNIAEKLRTYDFRADVFPIENLTVSGEVALQRGGDFFRGEGWWGQAQYAFANTRFAPTFSYRYAVVTGDDPSTPESEAFQPLAYGFTDYEQWYQGEIAGNWTFANTNQRTHMVKASVSLTDNLSLTGAWLNFTLDEPGDLGVISDDFGDEFDLFLDWSPMEYVSLSAAVATLIPGDAARQFTGGGRTWTHIMFLATFSL